MIDGFQTVWLLNRYDHLEEQNPIARPYMKTYADMLYYKSMILVMIICIMWYGKTIINNFINAWY